MLRAFPLIQKLPLSRQNTDNNTDNGIFLNYRVVRKSLKRLARPEGVEPPTAGSEDPGMENTTESD